MTITTKPRECLADYSRAFFYGCSLPRVTVMELKAALEGNLNVIIKEEKTKLEKAITVSIKKAGTYLRNELRRQVRSARLGKGLEKAWQVNVYPNRGRSMSASALVFSKSVRLHNVFEDGATIKANNASWLVIPLEFAISKGWDKNMSKSKGSQPRKWSAIDAAESYFGNLSFVPYSSSRALLCGKQGKQNVAVFLLVKSVTIKKKLDIDPVAEKWNDKIPDYIISELSRLDGT